MPSLPTQHSRQVKSLNLSQIIELTAHLAEHSPNLVEGAATLPRRALECYRRASQRQAASWSNALHRLPRSIARIAEGEPQLAWDLSEPLFVDILAGGMTARVWGTVLAAWARAQRSTLAERIAREALAGQLRAHEQVLRLMLDGPWLTLERALALDGVRRKIERWSDLFVGHLVRRYALADFAFDLERALDFGQEQLEESWGPRRERIWDLYFLCLRSTFPECRLAGGIHARRREELWAIMLSCLPREQFLDDGTLQSVRLRRLLSLGASRAS